MDNLLHICLPFRAKEVDTNFMENFPHLSRAPITEAVLNIQIAPLAGLEPAVLNQICSDAKEGGYVQVEAIKQANFTVGPSAPSASAQDLGFICWNAARTRAVQARVDGFAVNHVRDYNRWETLLEDAQTWWRHYSRVVGPHAVERCSVRFINRIELGPEDDWGTVLQTKPSVSALLPQEMQHFVQRIVLKFPEQISASVSVALPAPKQNVPRHVILDIDVWSDQPANLDEIWSTFGELRKVKNKCFFASLQEEKWTTYK